MLKIAKYKDLIKIILAVVFLIIIYSVLLYDTKFFAIARLKTIDLLYNLSYSLKPPPRQINDMVLVTIDDESFNKLQKRWPLERTLFASMLDKLNSYNPRVISIDMSFIGESKDKNDDYIFAKAIKDCGNVILSAYIGDNGEYVLPLKYLQDASVGSGFVNKPRDKDLYVRSARSFYYFGDLHIVDYSFEIKTAATFLGNPLSNISLSKNKIILIDQVLKQKSKIVNIPVNFDGTTAINYRAKINRFNTVPLWRILSGEVDANILKDKLVLIGATAEVFHDIYHTPFGVMPGVFINANDILMILSSDFIRDIPDYIAFFILFIMGLATCIFVYRLTLAKGFMFSFLEILLLFALSFILFLNNFHADYFSPVFAVLMITLVTDVYKHFNLIIESQILKTQAITDGLTGLFVHRYFKLRMDAEFERAKREESNLTLIIMDIDHFKNINDTYGHQNGNVVLKHISQILSGTSRKVDVVCRYGGEEFCVILPGTHATGASIYTERLRKSIEDYNFPVSGSNLKATMSLGIASFPSCGALSSDELIADADNALYRAKQTGRNKVCVFDPVIDKPDKNA